eukprot:NODE_9562_length_1414_cov_8.482517.p1 GENE.NODE_9562_length_1414_cov_8.482517~~NODE_9562_length_1414_cov_8.482517.p1  ORF type:complete len:399 (+),score=117.94 NODE_9562_length_1414_cov_8.482517:83-1198(+)
MGRTPEYMQERLRRFFAKFGPVQHCRAEPHPLDPYQCEGTAYVTMRDRKTALKALRAPLKFPASLHSKVVHMRDLDTEKRNDPDYYEKSKFWNRQLISLARRLHAQLLQDPVYCAEGKPLASAGKGLFEDELDLAYAAAARAAPPGLGRGGTPRSQHLYTTPTRRVAAGAAVRARFSSWGRFLTEVPLDELFKVEAAQDELQHGENALVVRPRLVSTTQRDRILCRVKMMLAERLHAEFSVWWREGKIPLPEYTQRRVQWWDHKPHLPFRLQILSRSKDRHKVHDERFLLRRQVVQMRNKKRDKRRDEWRLERSKQLEEEAADMEARREAARADLLLAEERGRLGLSRGFVAPPFRSQEERDEDPKADGLH